MVKYRRKKVYYLDRPRSETDREMYRMHNGDPTDSDMELVHDVENIEQMNSPSDQILYNAAEQHEPMETDQADLASDMQGLQSVQELSSEPIQGSSTEPVPGPSTEPTPGPSAEPSDTPSNTNTGN